MAQNVTIAGASYSAVPSVTLPKTGGGTASFVDTSDADATAEDIAQGKTAYVNGVKITGTASGGGSAEMIKVTMTNSRSSDISFYKISEKDGKICGLSLQAIASNATKTFNIPYNISSTGMRTLTYNFIAVRKNGSAPVFSDAFTSVSGKFTHGNYDIYRINLPSSFAGDTITVTVT